jgi:hypothetical protein
VRRDGDAFVVEAQAQLQADRPTARATLTDYERLPQFAPGIRRLDVLARITRRDFDGSCTLAVRRTAGQQFAALAAEIERRAAAGRALQAAR